MYEVLSGGSGELPGRKKQLKGGRIYSSSLALGCDSRGKQVFLHGSLWGHFTFMLRDLMQKSYMVFCFL